MIDNHVPELAIDEEEELLVVPVEYYDGGAEYFVEALDSIVTEEGLKQLQGMLEDIKNSNLYEHVESLLKKHSYL